jgi:acetyl-CoA C-acetyltransferase
MKNPVLVEAIRTPIGRGKAGKGALSGIHPVELLSKVQQEVVSRAGIDPGVVDQIIGGCVTQAGEQSNNLARNAWLSSGKDYAVAGTTVDAQCGSAQQANHLAAALIAAGQAEVTIACGAEVMSHVGLGANVINGPGFFQTENWPWDSTPDQFQAVERIAKKHGITRQDCDEFALRSQTLAKKATEEGRFDREILKIDAPMPDGSEGTHLVTRDEGLRDTTIEGLASLNTVIPDGVHTAGSASQLSDGAAAVLWMSEEKAKELGVKPRARLRYATVVGCDPYFLLDGPVDATKRMLAQSGMTLDDIDLYEINEAFATVVLSWLRTFSPDIDRLNTNGGAIALGHPVGATGSRLIVTALHELERRDLNTAFISMCCGSSLGTATILERM